MKKPDSWKHESWLRRILDADRFEQIVYFEEAVLADSSTLAAKGYFLFLVTETSLHCLQSGKEQSLNSQNTWLLTDLHAIQHLNDAATFFGANTDVAQTSRHIRCHVSDQVASPCSVIDFYSFYEDSALYHYLFQAWQQAHIRISLPMFYPVEKGSKLAKLNKLAVQALYLHLEGQLLATATEEEDEAAEAKKNEAASAALAASSSSSAAAAGASAAQTPHKPGDADGDGIDETRIKAQAAKLRAKRKKASDHEYWDVRLRIKYLEEMTLAVSVHKSFKQLAFDSALLIPFLLAQLRALSSFRAYLLGADPSQVWSYVASHEDRLLEDEVEKLRLAVAVWTFLARLLSGSEAIAQRTKLLAWNSTATERELREVMDALFLLGGIPVYTDPAAAAAAASQMNHSLAAAASAGPMSPGGASVARSRFQLAPPSHFLDVLFDHLSEKEKASAGGGGRGAAHTQVHLDEDEERYKQKYLYNLRTQRKWKEGVLGVQSESLVKDASIASAANKAKLVAQASALHIKDVPRIVQAQKEDRTGTMARRGPSRSRRDMLAHDRAFDAPPLADEIGYESVLVANDTAERRALEDLRSIVPELEVALLEMVFHFQQLLEFVLETRVPHLTFNLENFFRHVLERGTTQGGDDGEFKVVQIPAFAEGLVHMCRKERRETIAYFTFVYASVLCKCMLRSADLQAILAEKLFLDSLTVDHTNPTAAALQKMNAKATGKATGPTLALLPDIKASVHAAASRGLHFYQRTKPLLETMLKLLLDG